MHFKPMKSLWMYKKKKNRSSDNFIATHNDVKKYLHKMLGIHVVLVCCILALIFFPRSLSTWIEFYYIPYIYSPMVSLLSFISNICPWSFGESILAMIMIWLMLSILYILIALWQKQYFSAAKRMLSISSFVLINILGFQLLFGINAYRQPIEDIFQLDTSAITEEDLIQAYTFLVETTNQYHELLSTQSMMDKHAVMSSAYVGFKLLHEDYPFVSSSKVIVKPLFISPIFSSSGYTGIYLYFVGEPNINSMPMMTSIPFTACHEIAHQKGFASEDDANFMGFLGCIYHNHVQFNYSGYLSMLGYVGNSLYKTNPEKYRELASQRNTGVIEDLILEQQFWKEHIVEKNQELHNDINDAFLKANNQPEGIVSYSKVTELFVKAYKKGMFVE